MKSEIPPGTRAVAFAFTGRDGTTVRAVVDLLRYRSDVTLAQVTSNAVAAVIDAKGTGWIDDYTTTFVSHGGNR